MFVQVDDLQSVFLFGKADQVARLRFPDRRATADQPLRNDPRYIFHIVGQPGILFTVLKLSAVST